MKTNLTKLSCLWILTAATLAQADVEDRVTKSFTVSAGGKLLVEADRGSIEIKAADADKIEIEVLRKVTRESREKGEEILKNHEIEFSTEGGTVRVKSQLNKQWAGLRSDKARHLQVHYQISVPKKFNLDLKTAGGSVKVSDLTGEVKGQTSGGGLSFGKIEGPVFGRTSGGSITVGGCQGNVDVKTSGGGINIGEVQGDVAANTSGGSISIKKVTGSSVVKTSGGSIDVRDVKGRIEAGTSGGSVSASFAEPPAGDCALKTSGGSITLHLPEKAAVDIDARTNGGRVTTELAVAATVQGEAKPNVLQGKINGGGPAVSAQTSGGSIFLKKN